MGRHSAASHPDIGSVIDVSGLVVRFGPVLALDGVDLTVSAGQLIAVTGPSGAGKTTLLSVIGGSLAATDGTVSVNGDVLRDRDQAVAAGIVEIPQGDALLSILSAAENVALPLLSRVPVDSSAVRTTVSAALTDVGLEDARDQLPDELSGGQRQRVAIARALAQGGRILLADEPTSELDSGNRAVVMALLRREADRGAAVLMATHDPEAAALCDGELGLDSGRSRWI